MSVGRQIPAQAGTAFTRVVAEVIESEGGEMRIVHGPEEGRAVLSLGRGLYHLRRIGECRTACCPTAVEANDQVQADELERLLGLALEPVPTPPSP